MLRATFKSLLSRKARLFMSGLAVILGVAFISGTLILNASLGDSIRDMFATAYKNVDVQVTPDADESKDKVATIPADLVDEIKSQPHVDKATAEVADAAGGVQVLDKNEKVLPPTGPPTIGTNWTGVNDPMEMADGSGPEASDEVAINKGLSDATGYEVGDTMKLVLPNSGDTKPQSFEVSGVFEYSGNRGSLGGESTVSFTTETAQKMLLGKEDVFSSVNVKSDGSVSQTELKKQLSSELGGDYQIKTGDKLAEESAGQLSIILDFFNYLLLGFGTIALLVSVFLIINTFSIIVAQRTRELALFRAIGAGRGQVTRSVMLEAFIIGALAAVVGMAVGVGLGWAGTEAMSGLFGDLQTTLSIPMEAWIAAAAIGIGITMFAALLPALRAGRIPPIAALQDPSNTQRPVRWFAIIGGLLLVGGGALLTAALTKQFGKIDSDDTRIAVFSAITVLFLGAIIFTPVLARPLVSLIGFLFSWSLPGKLGRRNSGRNPRRTAITATALMIGITLVTGVGVMFSSANASIQKYMAKQVNMDLMISPATQGQNPPTFDKSVLDEAADIDGVTKVVDGYADSQATLDGEPIYVQATSNIKDFTRLLGVTKDKGEMDSLGPDEMLMSTGQAKDTKTKVGDTVEVTFANLKEPKEFTVSGIVNTGDFMAAPWIVDASNAKYFHEDKPMQAFIEVGDKDDVKPVMKDVNELLKDYPLVTVMDTSAFTEQLNQMFDIMLTVVQVLLGLAMLIAVIGVINTLTLSIRERTRELGLLRATGLTRGQVTRMVTVESIVISLFGALLGLGVGAGLGIAAQRGLRTFIDVLAMPWGTMAFYVVAAIVVGFFAALIPAYRANRINVLEAISYE
ncbi:ABC transporter permease [Stackebrandtia nassauensis]|uniref:ABC3 transporter permease protein domain-containing protein n=1 Tax=Stackebrandtia nassauensis (strain DSM 44728 / CIP 108903 / NRRL B-16338 / NBRC 102104 / LLR-40K-21) TaxID=446470 RepID=D3Q577_STANL|nr:FtsX-like permease family protein [Stackebrandtia nassauensis]ADD44126.1 protein of unknown function DUF214 [Stackebrandtia nassauensis DSM 44728]